jgi:predicted PurR-regulated permease PerM
MLADPRRRAAAALILVLGAVLTYALLPYASGLLAAPVLYILWVPLQRVLTRRLPAPLAASIILVLTFILIVAPGAWLLTLLVGQAQTAAQVLLASPLLERLQELRLGPIEVGPALAQMGQNVVTWIGANAFTVLGTAARFVLNLVFTFFGLYFLLVRPGSAWAAVERHLPFSLERARRLRQRFEAVTYSTVIGTGLNAVVQGVLTGSALAVVGIPNALFWGAVTVILSILPVVGAGLVWVPVSLSLALTGRYAAAIGLFLWGLVVVSNVDNAIRPYIYRRFAKIHPMITVVGAIVGVQFFGLVGLVLGPLAIQYFFELIRIYAEEYGMATSTEGEGGTSAVPPPASSSPPPMS